MSRIGKIPVEVPKEVKINVEAKKVHLEGPKGKLFLDLPEGITVAFKEQKLLVSRVNNQKQNLANHGTIRARLLKMVLGVSKGHKKELEIQGVGFRANPKGDKIEFNLGYSHPVEFSIPKDLKISVANQTLVTVEGADNFRVGEIAAKIKALKPVEPYKGKGIRYAGEFVRRKQGKSVTK